MLDRALHNLQAGLVVGIPTETVYGLAADVTNPKAIELIFKTKERPFFDPLIVHVASLDQVKEVAKDFPPLARRLAEKFWPGALTMILPRHENLNPMITSGLETVAVRMPRHTFTLELIRLLGHPLAAPSANKFGKTSPTRAEHVRSEFGDSVYVLDGGSCEVGIESTIVGFDNSYKKIIIYRPGAITAEMLSEFATVEIHPPQSRSAMPGQMEYHYVPNLPLILLSGTPHLTPDHYISLRERLHVSTLYPSWMALPADPALAARMLYANMRSAAEKPGANCILLRYDLQSKDHTSGAWAAITDRLKKAAHMTL